ncbi:MAG: ABC transporter permease [Bacteroidota bacterium]
MIPPPPSLALKFLRWFCRADYLDEVEGDLIEIYELQYLRTPSSAKRKFIWTVVRHFRPEFIKAFSQNSNTTTMLNNNLKIAWRHLIKQKMYSAIKIGGFALGIAACLLITLFVKDELKYDQHYTNKDQIFRLVFEFEGEGAWVWFPAPTAKALISDFPEIEKAGRLLNAESFGAGTSEIQINDDAQIFHESGFTYADHELLEILEIDFIKGDSRSALTQPNTIVISEEKAKKFFPKEDPIGQTIVMKNNARGGPFTITGVVQLKEASHFQYDFFMTLTGVELWPGEQDFWNATNYHTYFKVHPNTNIKQLEDKLDQITKKYFAPAWVAAGDQGVEEESKKVSYHMQPVSDIHLYNEEIVDNLNHGDIRFVWIFSAVALFILLIAAINFINLSTARSANRALEVGLRKTVGSSRGTLINQFLTESFVFSFIAFVVALCLASLLLPYFNTLSGKALALPLAEWWFLPGLFGTCLLLGILAGFYPALYLSSFKPINTLKGNLSKGSKSSGLRSTLVVFQFTTSIVLIIATFIIHRQMSFILNKDLGFDKNQVLMIQGTNTLGDQSITFKNELLNLAGVENVSISDYLPVAGTMRDNNAFHKEGMRGKENPILGQIWKVDANYINTMGMNLIDGRNFNADMISDSLSLIINQKMADAMGFENPVGQRIQHFSRLKTVIGVIDNFHFESMKDEIRPLCLAVGSNSATTSVKMQTEDIAGTITSIERIWKQFAPNQEIRYSFLDDRFALMYQDVQRMGTILSSFSVLAIVVACLGLFALSAFMVEQRTKEISIRLVLGASLSHIFQLLTSNFLKLVAISILIAAPMAYYFMDQWLADYTYRTTLGWDVFIISSGLVILIAIGTVGYQSVKAGLISPTENLRG